jgi:hypothetical protein
MVAVEVEMEQEWENRTADSHRFPKVAPELVSLTSALTLQDIAPSLDLGSDIGLVLTRALRVDLLLELELGLREMGSPCHSDPDPDQVQKVGESIAGTEILLAYTRVSHSDTGSTRGSRGG